MGSLSNEIEVHAYRLVQIERAIEMLQTSVTEIVVRIGRDAIEIGSATVKLDEETIKRIKRLIVDVLMEKRREFVEKLKQLVQGLE